MPTRHKPIVFISYAHEDEPEKPAEGKAKWLSFVTEHLRPAKETGAFDIWIDDLTAGGEDWDKGREQKLRACDIFVLLVSPHALSSSVAGKEIAIIRERQVRGERVRFYPLLLTPTPEIALELLGDEGLRPPGGTPFSSYPGEERIQRMLDAADEIVEIATGIAGPKKWRRSRWQLPAPTRPLPSLRAGAGREIKPEATDRNSLDVWLKDQSPEAVGAIAARAALRVPHGVVEAARKDSALFLVLAGALFRACALARIALKFPARANALHAQAQAAAARVAAAPAAAAAAAFTTGTTATTHALGAVAAALTAALAAADSAAREAPPALPGTADSAAHFTTPVAAPSGAVASAATFVAAIAAADARMRTEIRSDALAVQELGLGGLMDLQLWQDPPDWARDGWETLKATLESDEGWDVWIEWYEERLRGGSRGEAYELVFASVPQEVWSKGPAAANAWIKTHLPPDSGGPRGRDLPTPLPEPA